jgi:putative methionine-R-sulfoxide reductase with GAF domain
VVATLDIDSDKFGVLDEVDVLHLERLAKHIGQVIMK